MKRKKGEYYFIAVLLILFIMLTLFVTLGKLDFVDEYVFNQVIKLKGNALSKFLYLITNMASTIGIIILIILTAIIFIRKKALSSFKYVVINVFSGVLLMEVLKHIIKRVRPSWKWITQGGFSYPSGHTISALVFYGTLILLVSKKVNGKLRKPLLISFYLMIILTGFSRIYFGAHYLTDVLASVILGFIILIISNMFMNKEFNSDKNKNRKTI